MTHKPLIASSRILHKGFIQLKEDILERTDGLQQPYASLMTVCDATAILAQTKDGLWILNREYRHPVEHYLLGCPGGTLHPNEDPIEGGRREFFEETGYWCETMELLGCAYPCPALCNQKIYFLFGQNAEKKGNQKLDPFEFIDIELKTDTELLEEIEKGLPIDGILCAALWYKNLRKSSL